MNFNELKKLLKNDFSGLPVVKLAVLADSASQLFCMALKGYGYTQGIHMDIWEADYNSIFQTSLERDGGLQRTKPDYTIIWQSPKKLIADFYKLDANGKKEFANSQIDFIKNVTANISETITTKFIIVNYPELNDGVFGNYSNKTEQSFLFQLRKLNYLLMETAVTNPAISICDLSSIQNAVGSAELFSEKLYINTDNVIAIDQLPVFAKSITDIILAYSGKFKKCVVLDLDNTTWGGIIGDDGMEGIQIGELGIGKAFTEFQKWVIQLKQRGIILAVCSKNTESIAREPFDTHPDMTLRFDDFAVFMANWENKADNLRAIREVLNIGYDSMVFLDDNPAEREIIRRELPEVTVPELPEDPAEFLSFLSRENLFETASFTEADSKRNDQYREEAGRVVMQKKFTDEAGFLTSLEMTAEVKPVDAFSLPRASQLTQRSNQFNLRTVRYSEEQMKETVAAENKFTLSVTLKDKFGDYGLISLLILEKKNNEELFIDTWIMSCRVLKRTVEEFVLNSLVRLASENGCKKIIGEYLPTPKNGIVKDHFLNLGFSLTDNGTWEMEVGNYSTKKTYIV